MHDYPEEGKMNTPAPARKSRLDGKVIGAAAALIALACLIAVSVLGANADASAKKKIRPTPDRDPRDSRAASQLARAIASDPKIVKRAAFTTLPPFSNPAGISTKRIAGFPIDGSSFGILSNGSVLKVDKSNKSTDTSTRMGGPRLRGSRDVTILRIVLSAPKGKTCLSIRFKFLSEEFPEFIGDDFNDAFIAEVDKSTWNTKSSTDPRITAPDNFAYGKKGQLVSVNGAGATSMRKKYAKGTTYDGGTRKLRASTRISSGRTHVLYLSIFDQGDRDYDSSVLLDKLTIDDRKNCKRGAYSA